MPASTLSRSPQRVMARNLSGSSVSSETLMRLTPQSASSAAYFGELRAVGGQRQLVERAGRRGGATASENSVMMPRRTSGSPPVSRSLRTPLRDEGRAQPVELLERQQVGLRQERHVLGHAIDAAEIAAVRHRHAQIGDRPRERVDQRRRMAAARSRSSVGRASSYRSLGRIARILTGRDPATGYFLLYIGPMAFWEDRMAASPDKRPWPTELRLPRTARR